MDPRHSDFTSHRCPRPEGYAVRKHGKNKWLAEQGWSVWHNGYDWEWCRDTFELAVPGIRFCPWCGEELERTM